MSAFPLWAWIGTSVLISALLLLDLLVFVRENRGVSFRQATVLSVFWIALALLFGVVVFAVAGPARSGEYLTGTLSRRASRWTTCSP